MSDLDRGGLSAVPVSLILCVFIASLAVTVGVRGLDRAESLQRDQRAVHSFEGFVRVATEVSHGRLGESQRVKLDLEGFEILIDGGLVELRHGEEVLRSEYLPLPVNSHENGIITVRDGIYCLRLEKTADFKTQTEGQKLMLGLEESSG